MVLELNDIEEEEELEELEDGKVGRGEGGKEEVDGRGDTIMGGGSVSSGHVTPMSDRVDAEVETLLVHKTTYKRGALPVLPYYGCESMECHLLHKKRSHEELRLDQVSGVLLILKT